MSGDAVNETAIPDALPEPARPATLTVEFYEDPERIIIHKKRGGGPAAFLFLWLTGWTVGCVVLAVMLIRDPTIGSLLFALPFWASWLAVSAFLIWIVLGQETLLLRSDTAFFYRTAIIRLTSRIVPRAEVLAFRECLSQSTENDQHLLGIEMVTLGKPVRFAYRLPDPERAWLVFRLNQFLAATSSGSPPALPPPALSPPAAAPTAMIASAADGPPFPCQTMRLENTLADPPTDCDWTLDDQITAFEFSNRGRLSFASLFGLLFTNVFWNGIVSVFVLVLWGLMPVQGNRPQGWEWWGMFLFLIPFEVIGLLMLAGLVLVLLEPFRRTVWRFEQDLVIARSSWPLFRRSRQWEVAGLDRLELRRRRNNASQRSAAVALRAGAGQTSFELALVSGDNVDLCNIEGLTEGEARWIAHVLLKQRAMWFHGRANTPLPKPQ